MEQDRDTENRDTENRDTENRDTENRDTENRDTENRGMENRDMENRDTGNRDMRDRNRKRVIAVLAAGALPCAAAVTFLLYDYRRAGLESDRALASLRELEGKEMEGNLPPTS